MAVGDFASRRRATRSSGGFHLALVSSLLLCLLFSWCSAFFVPNPSKLTEVFQPVRDMTRRLASDYIRAADKPQAVLVPESSVNMEDEGLTQRQRMPLRLVSLNIRYATSKGARAPGEQPWSVRCPKVCTQLRFISAGHESPFICLQETLYSQLNDIQSHLGRPWAHIGRGRDKGETDGEFSPIFYRSDIWACERNETRWLSPTPEKPSRGWDAALNRIVTIGLFKHLVKGTHVVVMSTHFDHLGVEARKNSAKLLIRIAREWSNPSSTEGDDAKPARTPSAVLIGGDFNSPPDDEAYKMMTAPNSGMSDISDLLPEDKHHGNHLTYTSFGEAYETPQRIDFLFIQEPRTAEIETFGVLPNSFDDQIRFSDHRPVVSDLNIVA